VIVDFHCHGGRGDALTEPATTDAPLRAYLRRARAAGIGRTVICPAFHSDYSVANRELADIVERHRDRLIGFAFVHTGRDAGRIFDMVERAVNDYGFRGIKVHGSDSMPTRELCETARAFNLPVLVDVVGRAHTVDMFAPQYPDVNFVVAHLGSFMDDWRALQRVCDQLARLPNVYADTGGTRRFDYILQAVRRAGPRKVLFGSDGPWLHPGVELAKIRYLGLSPADFALVAGGNAMRLLRGAGRRRAGVRPPARRRQRGAAAWRGAGGAAATGRLT
jgi:predicted TIM-barrel fold metal-dependent hydrolase